MLMYHLLLKKMALFSFLSFVLSKISFVLASLVALKQFFHTPMQSHRSADSHKLEVVHIPIRKKKKDSDWEFEESQFIPVSYSPDTEISTSYPPFYNFRDSDNEPETFAESDEKFEDSFDEKFMEKFNEKYNKNEIYNEHFKDDLPNFDRSDGHTEKNYYKNHVRSPFV